MFNLQNFIVLAGVWALGNGVLHDIFVLRQHRPYDKELIRLLIDGHILIFSGIIYLLCYTGLRDHQLMSYLVAVAVAIFLLGYCALIFKILPSIVTIVINLVAIVWLLVDFSSGQQI